jgi:hypothetical protein
MHTYAICPNTPPGNLQNFSKKKAYGYVFVGLLKHKFCLL